MVKTIIVENEKQHLDYLTGLISKHFPELEILSSYDNVPDGISGIISLRPQLVFLDIELPPYTGFDLLEKTRDIAYEVIFTTSWNKYAAKAFRFCALDFIEKPYGFDELKEALTKYKNVASGTSKRGIDALLHNIKQADFSMQKIGIPVLGGIDFIAVSEIILCQSDDNCTDFYLLGKRKITATKTLKWVVELLKEHNFSRIHDSYFINLNHIIKYKRGGEGGVVEMAEGYEADVSRRRKDDFLKSLTDLRMIHKK